MASLRYRSRRMGLVLAVALGLTVLTATTTPLLGNLFGPTVVHADEPADSGG